MVGWCIEQLDGWPVAHDRRVITAHGARTHVVTAGSGEATVLVVPGTNFGAAAYLQLGAALATHRRVVLVDLPGQPGLSSGERVPGAGRLDWYGRWLGELVEQTMNGPVTVVGHSLGAAIALSSDSPLVQRQILVSPGGLTRLRITPAVLLASVAWVLRRRTASSTRLLRLMYSTGHSPRPELVEWMTLVARHVRSSADPGGVALTARHVDRAVVVGDSDVFLPSRTLAPAVQRRLGVQLEVIGSAGHLVTDEFPDQIAELATGQSTPGRLEE